MIYKKYVYLRVKKHIWDNVYIDIANRFKE
jgi:hypothetical protein